MQENPKPNHDIGARLMQHRRTLYSYVFACVRDEHTAEDIVQDVAQIAISSIDSLRDPERFSNWLFGIARRRVLMEFRNHKREQVMPPDVVELLAVASENTSLNTVSRRKQFLTECIEDLPDEMQAILRHRYDGSVQDISELAVRFDRTVQAVYGVLKRLRVKLATCVERKLAEAGP
ncbi:sigma-70 family RNA polymerase sigma factor [Bremerella sp. P1]|uniref:sigma-70 family RNA polymerase sigma factor n=1 Tax=Bremerella sp. P1 TaxID=3026424 RepID=UPI002368C7F6|nr:sigma-70 family RNA polymerase sigma factor [Bremerella sp. P1]WDI41565.1 sigma-70 family RNA polymerase sigma factor [Bremerella sp. P1]